MTVCVILALILAFIILFYIIKTCKYYIKRKFDSIDKFNESLEDKSKDYNENKKDYEEKMYKSGAKTSKKNMYILDLIKNYVHNAINKRLSN